jgi:diguanylate cyclase (GGDEF)-like protein
MVGQKESRMTSDPSRILVVDDVAINLILLRALMEKLGDVEVTTQRDPAEALGWCVENTPDLVLLDFAMPGMNGDGFLECFRAIPHCAAVPVLIVTGKTDRATLLSVLASGANDFIRKPVDEIELSARARSMLRLGRASRELYRQSTTDELTGLSSRRHFLARMQGEFDRLRRFGGEGSFALLDVDHFKHINDTLGHAAGDEVLRGLGAALLSSKRRIDAAGRLGGEEFGLLLVGTPVGPATGALRRICGQLSATLSSGLGRVTVSGGVAEFDGSGSVEQVMVRADRLLYAAKAAGRNRIFSSDPASGNAEPINRSTASPTPSRAVRLASG